MSATKSRDREETKALLIESVGDVIARDGYGAVGVNAVARAAGVDKVLIYRYFGGFPELLQAFGEEADFWWQVDDLLPPGGLSLQHDDLAASLTLIFEGHLNFLRHHPVTLEILAWEMTDRNELTIALEYVREQRSLELMRRLLEQYGQTNREAMVHFGPVMALLGGAAQYLATRARHIKTFNGLDLQSDRGWQQMLSAVDLMLAGIVTAPLKGDAP